MVLGRFGGCRGWRIVPMLSHPKRFTVLLMALLLLVAMTALGACSRQVGEGDVSVPKGKDTELTEAHFLQSATGGIDAGDSGSDDRDEQPATGDNDRVSFDDANSSAPDIGDNPDSVIHGFAGSAGSAVKDAVDAAIATGDPGSTTPGATAATGDQDKGLSGAGESVCVLTVRCDTILANWSKLNPEKAELVPGDGIVFSAGNIQFHEGESVFNVLQREMKKAGIHLEFVNSPIYNSAYIKGINNLYERDCGELSGWEYRVNGKSPGYGCSQYTVEPGDVIEIVYTCDLGRDINGGTRP